MVAQPFPCLTIIDEEKESPQCYCLRVLMDGMPVRSSDESEVKRDQPDHHIDPEHNYLIPQRCSIHALMIRPEIVCSCSLMLSPEMNPHLKS